MQTDLEADDIDELLSVEAKLSLYRIMQEAISNIVRHSGASTVSIRLSASDDTVTGMVEDDGSGFSVESQAVLGGRGLGMLGMQERAAILGGEVRVESEIGRGTRVHIRLPASS